MLNHVYTHEGMSHFGGGTCHNVKWFAISTYSTCTFISFVHCCHFCHFSLIFLILSIPGHVLVLKSNLLCSFRSKSRSIDFPLFSSTFSTFQERLSIIYSFLPLNLFKIFFLGTTCCAIVPISMGAPTVLCCSANRSFHEYLLISCCFLVFA